MKSIFDFYVLVCKEEIPGYNFQIFDYLTTYIDDESIGPPGRGWFIIPTKDIQSASWFGSKTDAEHWLKTMFPVGLNKFHVSNYEIVVKKEVSIKEKDGWKTKNV